jgi:hypothetical protein
MSAQNIVVVAALALATFALGKTDPSLKGSTQGDEGESPTESIVCKLKPGKDDKQLWLSDSSTSRKKTLLCSTSGWGKMVVTFGPNGSLDSIIFDAATGDLAKTFTGPQTFKAIETRINAISADMRPQLNESLQGFRETSRGAMDGRRGIRNFYTDGQFLRSIKQTAQITR